MLVYSASYGVLVYSELGEDHLRKLNLVILLLKRKCAKQNRHAQCKFQINICIFIFGTFKLIRHRWRLARPLSYSFSFSWPPLPARPIHRSRSVNWVYQQHYSVFNSTTGLFRTLTHISHVTRVQSAKIVNIKFNKNQHTFNSNTGSTR